MIDVFFDGAASGHPGLSGGGLYINHGSGVEERESFPLGVLTNHEAEFGAFLHALNYCLEKRYLQVSFRTDSQLVERAVEKRYVKNQTYDHYLQKALVLIDRFDLFFLKWIPDKQNRNADELAKKAIFLQKNHPS